MHLIWFGQACFKLTATNGTSIITDPYDTNILGYKAVTQTADMVVRSSPTDESHSRVELIPGNPELVEALDIARASGSQDVQGVNFSAIETLEYLKHPEHEPEANAMYRFILDDLDIAHMGDVGNPLTEQQLEFLKDADVLLALAGGPPVIELEDLKKAIDYTTPRLVIPMHFRTLSYKPRSMHWISSFLSYFDENTIDFACSSEISLSKADLPDKTRVLVMDYIS